MFPTLKYSKLLRAYLIHGGCPPDFAGKTLAWAAILQVESLTRLAEGPPHGSAPYCQLAVGAACFVAPPLCQSVARGRGTAILLATL